MIDGGANFNSHIYARDKIKVVGAPIWIRRTCRDDDKSVFNIGKHFTFDELGLHAWNARTTSAAPITRQHRRRRARNYSSITTSTEWMAYLRCVAIDHAAIIMLTITANTP